VENLDWDITSSGETNLNSAFPYSRYSLKNEWYLFGVLFVGRTRFIFLSFTRGVSKYGNY